MSEHTPAPWHYQERSDAYTHIVRTGARRFLCQLAQDTSGEAEANARLIAASPDLLEALRNVNKLISEAAMTGFNCHDGDWAERLFHSQQATSTAIKKATTPAMSSPNRQGEA